MNILLGNKKQKQSNPYATYRVAQKVTLQLTKTYFPRPPCVLIKRKRLTGYWIRILIKAVRLQSKQERMYYGSGTVAYTAIASRWRTQ